MRTLAAVPLIMLAFFARFGLPSYVNDSMVQRWNAVDGWLLNLAPYPGVFSFLSGIILGMCLAAWLGRPRMAEGALDAYIDPRTNIIHSVRHPRFPRIVPAIQKASRQTVNSAETEKTAPSLAVSNPSAPQRAGGNADNTPAKAA